MFRYSQTESFCESLSFLIEAQQAMIETFQIFEVIGFKKLCSLSKLSILKLRKYFKEILETSWIAKSLDFSKQTFSSIKS